MLRHDLIGGIVKRSAQLLVPIGLFLLIVWMNQATFQRIDVEFGKEATLGMYLLYLFAGCLPAGVSGNDFFAANRLAADRDRLPVLHSNIPRSGLGKRVWNTGSGSRSKPYPLVADKMLMEYGNGLFVL